MLNKVKENLSVDLNYQVNYDYRTGDRSVELVYRPTAKLQGIEAATGNWMTAKDTPKTFQGRQQLKRLQRIHYLQNRTEYQ